MDGRTHDSEGEGRVNRNIYQLVFSGIAIGNFLFITACTTSPSNGGDLAEVTPVATAASVTTRNPQGAPTPDVVPANLSLVLASRYGHEEVVRTLLDSGVDVNLRDDLGRTALIATAGEPHETLLTELLERGADVNAHDDRGNSALMTAAGRGELANVRSLLRAGADLEARNNDGETALISAIKFGQADVVELLLDRGADANIYDQDQLIAGNQMTPLMVAADYGANGPDSVRIAHALLAHGATLNLRRGNGDTALTIAERKGYRALAAELQRQGARDESPYIGLSNEDALLKAVKLRDEPKAIELLTSGADPNYRDDKTGITPLVSAAYFGQAKIARLLIDKGADVNDVPWGLRDERIDASGAPMKDRDLMRTAARGDAPLMTAIREGHTEIVKLLLQHDALVDIPNRNLETPGILAARKGNAEIMAELLSHGLNPDITEIPQFVDYFAKKKVKKERIRPLLVEAAVNGHNDTVRILLQGRADANVRDERGRTALYWAAEDGHFRTVQTLLNFHADPNLADYTGSTPLMPAAKSGYVKIVRTLLDHGAHVNVIDGTDQDKVETGERAGMTPLIYAARGGHAEIVRLLLARGADRRLRTTDGDTAVDVARRNGHDDIVSLLGHASN